MIVSAKYDSWEMQSPDGSFLAYCDARKANWYVSRDLATLVKDNIIRLNFTPKGKDSQKRTKIKPRENRCVVCGTTEKILTRHHVVPKIYRQPMPECLKKHASRDVVFLCVDCHEEYEEYAYQLKAEIAYTWGFPLFLSSPFRQALSFTCTLNNHGKKMPPDRKTMLEEKLKLALQQLTDGEKEEVKKISQKSKKQIGKFLKSLSKELNYHGRIIIRKMQQENGIESLKDFIDYWRDHFTSCMKPKFLPADWEGVPHEQ